jgi:hypothetical protein
MVQKHDNRVRVSFFCHPELVSGSRFLVLRIWVLKPRPVGGVLYFGAATVFHLPEAKGLMNRVTGFVGFLRRLG